MADFGKALNRSSVLKGSYVVTPDKDEIYRGISRRFHPAWGGWPVVDALKFAASNDQELEKTLEQNEKLKKKVREFHKQMYWDRFRGDEIQNQEVAAELFDAAIEMGLFRSVLVFQKSLNSFHGGRSHDEPLVEDGLLGPKTMEALERYLQTDDLSLLINIMRIRQSAYYLARLRRKPRLDAFARDWLKRLKISRESRDSIPAPPTALRVD
jgi:lysozyme family protein